MKPRKAGKPRKAIEIQAHPSELTLTPPVTIPPILLRSPELAAKLAVPVTLVREKTRVRARERDADPLPLVRLGKYVRFDWAEVEAWLKRQSR
jgi:predicted DNA-binding transcriptional regulator AlpA